MEGLGKDCIIVESIGAGQSDKDLFFLCDTIITIFTPEYGDEIQLFKAGLMEIGDIIVVNKSDSPGAEDAAREIALVSSRSARANGWEVPVLMTQARSGSGISGVIEAMEGHWLWIAQKKGGAAARKAGHVENFMMALLKEELWQKASVTLMADGKFKEISREVRSGKMDPYSAVQKILEELELKWISH